jgi:hypothetical protein
LKENEELFCYLLNGRFLEKYHRLCLEPGKTHLHNLKLCYILGAENADEKG